MFHAFNALKLRARRELLFCVRLLILFMTFVINVVIFIYKISTKSVQSIMTKRFVIYDNLEAGLRHLPSFMKLLILL